MKVGAEDRRKLAAACGLLGLATVLIAQWIFGSQWSAFANVAGGVMNPSAPARPVAKAKTKVKNTDTLDPTLQLAQLELTEHEMYEGTGRNIFQSYGEDQPQKAEPSPTPKPQRPVSTILVTSAAPPIGLKLFGLVSASDSPRKACLSQDGDVFIGAEGNILNRRYKVLHIGSNTVDLEDLLENKQYTLALQQ